MTQYPVVLEVKQTDKGLRVKASTGIDKALEGAEGLHAQLRCVEIDYAATLAAVQACLGSAGSGRYKDPRAYWFAGKHLADFIARLEVQGFYLVDKNKAPARHLAISRASVEKMVAFYSRYPDPTKIDTSIPWSRYRDNRE